MHKEIDSRGPLVTLNTYLLISSYVKTSRKKPTFKNTFSIRTFMPLIDSV